MLPSTQFGNKGRVVFAYSICKMKLIPTVTRK